MNKQKYCFKLQDKLSQDKKQYFKFSSVASKRKILFSKLDN